jgi:lipopolysaccharide/colanic/teichoic acid biosynthesis glycosyltransferase
MPSSLNTILAFILLIMLLPFLCFATLLAGISTKSSGFFTQQRIGQNAKPFTIYKLRTMRNAKVTRMGRFLRKTKIDELPQLINILKGDMSFVGPRPDVPGYYDQLQGKDRRVLLLKPGLTSLAAIKYRKEEELLAHQEHPLLYNDQVIFPDKVKMNLEYLEKRSFWYDVKIILLTLKSVGVSTIFTK